MKQFILNRSTLVTAVSMCLCGVLLQTAHAASLIPKAPTIKASSYLLVDATSGQTLVEYNADEPLPPASLTKLMTSYVVSHELAEGSIKNSDMATVSKKAWAKNFPGSSLMWIEVGKQVSVGDLHKGIVISSGNDASVAIAEYIAGSEEAFAEVMNTHADALGMTNSHFVNSHGLPHTDHYTSAADLAKLAHAIITEYPEEYALYSQKEYTFNDITTNNRNRLLWRDDSVDGLKTGHTQEAGYCLVASAERDGMRLISVVMGASSEDSRVQETQKLLAYGFRFFETHKLYSAGDVVATEPLWSGVDDEFELGVSDDIYLTIPKRKHDQLKTQVLVGEEIQAPIVAGNEYGFVSVSLGDDELLRKPLVALKDVEQAGLFSRLWDGLVLWTKGFVASRLESITGSSSGAEDIDDSMPGEALAE